MKNLSLDHKQCYAAMQAQDFRFDGLFFVGVSTTGVYCRPVCPVRLPRADRCTFYPSAASAERAGFRPCLRCRPELAPGHSRVDAVKRVAHLAVERIRSGALTENSLDSLAQEFRISSRQLRRIMEAEYGVGPKALALTCRLLLAKQLLTDTPLKIIDVAFASGFSSLRRFNDAFRRQYRMPPSALRKKQSSASDQNLVLRLAYRPPIAWKALLAFLGSRGNPRVERSVSQRYIRTVSLGKYAGWIVAEQNPRNHQIRVELSPSLLPCLVELQARLRRLFDLDANPSVIEEQLRGDDVLQPLIDTTPGLRIPGTLDSFELSLRAVLGQQVSVKAASTLFGRFVDRFGKAVETPFSGLDKTAPVAGAVAGADLQDIIDLGLPGKRAQTVRELARMSVEGALELNRGDWRETVESLLEVPGIGPWTAQYIAMRALGDPNAFPESDLGLLRALGMSKPADVSQRAERWQPWRAYGAMYLWHHLNAGG